MALMAAMTTTAPDMSVFIVSMPDAGLIEGRVALFVGVALFFARFQGEGLLDLTFKLPNYVYGAIFGSIVLARIGVGRFATFLLGFVSACAVTAWLAAEGVAFFFWCPVAGLVMVAVVLLAERRAPEWTGVVAARA